MPAQRTLAHAPSLSRLTTVEFRKMADTRAGMWLLASIGAICVAIITIQLFVVKPDELTFKTFLEGTFVPVSVLLPVLGILSVTSEWTQRTNLTTFALVPERHRIATAKLVAAVAIAGLSIAASLATAALGNLAGMAFADGNGSWHLAGDALAGAALAQVISVVMGVGFGMLLMNSAFAIVLYFLLPTVWTVLAGLSKAVEKASDWLNIGATTEPLFEGAMTGGDWRRLGASVGLWLVLPLAFGVVRLLKREVK